jgi:hypothetical protein
MAAQFVLHALDPRGEGILDELEERTRHHSERLERGERRYTLLDGEAGLDTYDPVLDAIDPEWKDHVSGPVG